MPEIPNNILENLRSKGFSDTDIAQEAQKRGYTMPPQQKSFAQGLGEKIGSGIRGIFYQPEAVSALDAGQEAFSKGEILKGVGQYGSGVIGAGLGAIGSATRAVAAPLNQSIESGIGAIGDATGLSDDARNLMSKLAQTKTAQSIYQKTQDVKREIPGVYAAGAGALEAAGNLSMVNPVKEAVGSVSSTIAKQFGKLSQKAAAQAAEKKSMQVLDVVGPPMAGEAGGAKAGAEILSNVSKEARRATLSGQKLPATPTSSSWAEKKLGIVSVTNPEADKTLSGIKNVFTGVIDAADDPTTLMQKIGVLTAKLRQKTMQIAETASLKIDDMLKGFGDQGAGVAIENKFSVNKLAEDTGRITFRLADDAAQEEYAQRKLTEYATAMQEIIKRNIDESLQTGKPVNGASVDRAITEFNQVVTSGTDKAMTGSSISAQAANTVRRNARNMLADMMEGKQGEAYRKALMDEYYAITGENFATKRFGSQVGQGKLEAIGKVSRPYQVGLGAATGGLFVAAGLGVNIAPLISSAVALTLAGVAVSKAVRAEARKEIFKAVEKMALQMSKVSPEEKVGIAEEIGAAMQIAYILSDENAEGEQNKQSNENKDLVQ